MASINELEAKRLELIQKGLQADAAKEARTSVSNIAALSSQLAGAFGDTSTLGSQTDFNVGQGLQSASLGLSTYTALSALGLVGMGIGAGVGVLSFAFGRSKRRKARRAAEARWRQGLAKYKEQVKSLKRSTETSEAKIEKAIGSGVQFSLLDQAKRDAETATKLTEAQRGVKATTYQKARQAEAESAAGEVEVIDTILMEKLNLLDEAQVLAQKEIEAKRGVFGSYKTEYADRLADKLQEFEEYA